MDTKITVDRTPELLKYLKDELGIEEITPEDFARNVNEEFLLSKPDYWIQHFYEFLNGKHADRLSIPGIPERVRKNPSKSRSPAARRQRPGNACL